MRSSIHACHITDDPAQVSLRTEGPSTIPVNARQGPCLPCTTATAHARLAHGVPMVHCRRGSSHALIAFLLSACSLTPVLRVQKTPEEPTLELTFLASNLYLAIMHLTINVVTCPGDNICYCPVTGGWSLLEWASLSAVLQTTPCDVMVPPSAFFLEVSPGTASIFFNVSYFF